MARQNNTIYSTRPELKLRARKQMGQAFGACSILGFLVAIVGMLVNAFQQRTGGSFLLYSWDTASNDIQNSVTLSAEGLFAALRVEEMGVGFSLVITPAVLGTFLLIRLITTVVTAPFKLGCLENLWWVCRGQPRPVRMAFSWYADVRRAGKAVVMEVVFWLVQTLLQGILLIPALLAAVRSDGGLVGLNLASWLLVLSQLVVYCLMTQIMPARYLLSGEPDKGVGKAFREGWALLRGRHGQYLLLRLSFIIWDLLNNLSRGMFNLYLYPYEGITNIYWLEESGKNA